MRRLITLVLGIAGVAIVGCTNQDSGVIPLSPTDSVVTGTFDLTLVGGQPLPVPFGQTTTDLWAVSAEKIVIDPDLTWADTTQYVLTSFADGSTRDTISTLAGTYAVSNSQINFVSTSGTVIFTGSVTGDVLSVLVGTSRSVYTRQK